MRVRPPTPRFATPTLTISYETIASNESIHARLGIFNVAVGVRNGRRKSELIICMTPDLV